MNAQTNARDAQEATPGRGRGRGGRGRGFGNRNASTKPNAANAAKAKVGPTRLLETEWIKDSLLKEDSFCFWIGSGKAGNQQWTVHRPIGETSLAANAWVMTPARDLGFLLARRESEELSSWKRKSELAIRQAVLQTRTGRRLMDDQTEVWTFDGAPAIQPTIRACMTAAKAAGKPEAAWLDYADNAVQVAERSFKEALRTQAIPDGWLRVNPKPAFQTMGGPLGDIPQKAVGYLASHSLSSAKDKVLRVLIGIESNDTDDEDDEPENPADHTTPKASPKGKNAVPASAEDTDED